MLLITPAIRIVDGVFNVESLNGTKGKVKVKIWNVNSKNNSRKEFEQNTYPDSFYVIFPYFE